VLEVVQGFEDVPFRQQCQCKNSALTIFEPLVRNRDLSFAGECFANSPPHGCLCEEERSLLWKSQMVCDDG